MSEKNITFEIVEHLGVISRYDSGWNKELNLISWNGAVAKYDVRDWDPHHERMGRGLTLYEDEMRKLTGLYLSNNSRKAVEKGRAIEEGRKERRQEQRRAYSGQKKDDEGFPVEKEKEVLEEPDLERESLEEAL